MCSKKENLRLCKFTLGGCDELGYAQLGAHDYANNQEREEATRKRTGRFHTWGFELQPRTVDGKMISCAIVEDIDDGQVYCINPENIQFTDLKG